MNRGGIRIGVVVGALLLLGGSITACTGSPPAPDRSSTPTATSSSSPSTGPSEGSGSTPAPTSGGPGTGDGTRFIIDCVGVDGSSSQFATLDDAWASTNYVRISSCTAGTADDGVRLTDDEQRIAVIADSAGDPMSTYLQVLASCVRITPDEIPQQPEGLLRAVLALCPDTPEAGLISSALQSEEAG